MSRKPLRDREKAHTQEQVVRQGIRQRHARDGDETIMMMMMMVMWMWMWTSLSKKHNTWKGNNFYTKKETEAMSVIHTFWRHRLGRALRRRCGCCERGRAGAYLISSNARKARLS